VLGMLVCRKHGGAIQMVQARAELRLAGIVDTSIDAIIACSTQSTHLPTKLKAAQDVLDRVGIGEPVKAKVRASMKSDQGKGQITVNLGFINQVDGTPTTVYIPAPAPEETVPPVDAIVLDGSTPDATHKTPQPG